MLVETGVRDPYEFAVEPLLIRSRLAAADQEDCVALGIKCESNPPFAVGQGEAQFLHIRVPRPVQRVAVGPTKFGPNRRRSPARAAISSSTSSDPAASSASKAASYSTTYSISFHPEAKSICCQ